MYFAHVRQYFRGWNIGESSKFEKAYHIFPIEIRGGDKFGEICGNFVKDYRKCNLKMLPKNLLVSTPLFFTRSRANLNLRFQSKSCLTVPGVPSVIRKETMTGGLLTKKKKVSHAGIHNGQSLSNSIRFTLNHCTF